MFKFSREGEDGKLIDQCIAKLTGAISSSSPHSCAIVGDPDEHFTLIPGVDPPPGYSNTKLELLIKDHELEPDKRTELHRAKSKKLIEGMVPSRLEEIGSTTWVKKVNAVAIIVNQRKPPNLMKDVVILDHLVKHKKVTVLIHDLVLVVVWRNEILPKLVEFKQQKETTAATSQVQKQSRFQISTICMVVSHAQNLSNLIAGLIARPEILVSLGTDLYDLVDYILGELRFFINNRPAHDPAKDKPPDFDTRLKDNDTVAGNGLGGISYERQCSHATTMIVMLFTLLDPKTIAKIPFVLLKVIHPDTKYIITLVDLVLTRPARYSKKNYVHLVANTTSVRNRRGRVPLNALEATSWSLIHRALISDAKKLPAAAFQVTEECYDKVMLLRPLLEKERLRKAMPELKELQAFLCQLASINNQPPEGGEAGIPSWWAQLPPSPNFTSILAELELDRDAILRIHTAMGTFEQGSMTNACRRMTRDKYCLLPLCDMNNCCFYCGTNDAELTCSRCRYAHYCDKKCQSKDWGTHKLICSRR